MTERINRRRMLGMLGGTAAAAALGACRSLKSGQASADNKPSKPRSSDTAAIAATPSPSQPKPAKPKVAIAREGTPEQMVDAAILELGGMGAFVRKGDRVLVKPNIGWDRKPEFAANTNPAVVARVVELCLNAGAKEVTVLDRSCADPRRSYANSGILAAATSARARVVQADKDRVTEVDLKGEVLRKWEVFDEVLAADVRINVPIAKHHALAKVTLGMKNWMGCLSGDRSKLHQDIHRAIVDLAAWFRPSLTILDAYRIMISNGPTGGRLSDVRLAKTICAGTDPVAVDAFGASLFGIGPDDLESLLVAEKRGLGNRRPDPLSVQEIDLKRQGA